MAKTPMTLTRAIGYNVLRRRNTKGLSIARLAERAGIGQLTLIGLEKGAPGTAIRVLPGVASGLGVSVATLIEEAEFFVQKGTWPEFPPGLKFMDYQRDHDPALTVG